MLIIWLLVCAYVSMVFNFPEFMSSMHVNMFKMLFTCHTRFVCGVLLGNRGTLNIPTLSGHILSSLSSCKMSTVLETLEIQFNTANLERLTLVKLQAFSIHDSSSLDVGTNEISKP